MYKEYVLKYKLKTSPYLWIYACIAESENDAIKIFKNDCYSGYNETNIEYIFTAAINNI